MKSLAIAAALLASAVLLPTGSAQAAGCVKGAVVGGVAGHFVGHHGLLGAGVGCLIGRHEANRRGYYRSYPNQRYTNYYYR